MSLNLFRRRLSAISLAMFRRCRSSRFNLAPSKASAEWRRSGSALITQRLQPAEPIPGWLLPLIEKVEAHGGPSTQIAQVLCTEYEVCVGIGRHRDKRQFDRIFGLSLGSPCKFRFRRAAGEKWQRYTLVAAPGSLYRMSGESRRIWEHSIPAVEAPRCSINLPHNG
jgi:alkylated DNA repair dioxygenase AlkB